MVSEGSTISQQLAILRMKNLVEARKAGNSTCYRLRGPHVNELLDVGRRIFESHNDELRSMTGEPTWKKLPGTGLPNPSAPPDPTIGTREALTDTLPRVRAIRAGSAH